MNSRSIKAALNSFKRTFVCLPLGIALLAALPCGWAQTPIVKVIHSFAQYSGFYPEGPLTKGQDGDFYGTTESGGLNGTGTVYKLTSRGVVTTLYHFSSTDTSNENQDGAYPIGSLVLGSDGNFYGVTEGGGTGGNVSAGTAEEASGTIFKITPAGVLTTLYRFASEDESKGYTNANGASPYALIQGTDGNFYGTTVYGGTGAAGTVFKITSTGTLTTLHSFAATTGQNSTTGYVINTDGAYPEAPLLQGSDGSFYGTAFEGGTNGAGTVFKITSAGAFTSLHTFSAVGSTYTNSDGASPFAGLVQAKDGGFYGTASGGGKAGTGTVFTMTSTGTLNTIYNFSAVDSNGYNNDGEIPETLTLGSDGNLYGVAAYGGTGGTGTIFKLTTAGVLTPLHSFASDPGDGEGNRNYKNLDGESANGLVQSSDGNFYGTTTEGYATGAGTFFQITPSGTLTTLFAFGGNVGGGGPNGALVEGSDGDLYGTTSYGGTFDSGTVFQMTPSAAISVLHDFGNGDPALGLIQGTDGDFYVTDTFGSYFRLTSAGAITTLANVILPNPLIQGTDGNFYGTTLLGGTGENGTFFKITPAGVLTVLHNFTGTATDGGLPQNALLQGKDGNFYGTTSSGGSHTTGTVFKATPAGVVTTLYNISISSDGGNHSAFIQAPDGNFYGTAHVGGSNGTGVAFKVTPAGVYAVLHPFSAQDSENHNGDGAAPQGALLQGADGNLYGTASQGGADGAGTVFKITTAGAFTTLYSFGATTGDGAGPDGALILDRNGDLVGTTQNGGVSGAGTIFSVTLAPTITSPLTASATVGQAFSYQIKATGSPTSYAAPGLPSGLTLNTTTGLISGTPRDAGTAAVTISATNAVGKASARLTITISKAVAAPVITSATSATATQGKAFSYQITASGSPTSYAAPGLPSGLSLDITTGLISGTPKNAGKAAVTISATNVSGTGSARLTITITALPVITSATTATATVGKAFSYQITASNEPTSYAAKGLPTGLSVDTTTGLITGTLKNAGKAAVTISATNAAGTGSAKVTITIASSGA